MTRFCLHELFTDSGRAEPFGCGRCYSRISRDRRRRNFTSIGCDGWGNIRLKSFGLIWSVGRSGRCRFRCGCKVLRLLAPLTCCLPGKGRLRYNLQNLICSVCRLGGRLNIMVRGLHGEVRGMRLWWRESQSRFETSTSSRTKHHRDQYICVD